jgi:hypothetical protein
LRDVLAFLSGFGTSSLLWGGVTSGCLAGVGT